MSGILQSNSRSEKQKSKTPPLKAEVMLALLSNNKPWYELTAVPNSGLRLFLIKFDTKSQDLPEWVNATHAITFIHQNAKDKKNFFELTTGNPDNPNIPFRTWSPLILFYWSHFCTTVETFLPFIANAYYALPVYCIMEWSINNYLLFLLLGLSECLT